MINYTLHGTLYLIAKHLIHLNDRFNERAVLLHAVTEIIAIDNVCVLTSIQKEKFFIHILVLVSYSSKAHKI